MLVRFASHAHPIYMTLKDFGSQRLTKGIYEIIRRSYFGNCYVTSLHNLFDYMIFSLYVLLTFMDFLFLGLCDCPPAITVNCEQLSCQKYHFKFQNKSFEPYCFLSCFTSCNVFSLQCGISGTFLFDTSPANSFVAKYKHISRGEFRIILI